MVSRLTRFKPGVHRKTHLLLAACLWSFIGLLLMARGFSWLLPAGLTALALPAVLLGFLKSHFVLDKTANKSINRIMLLDDGTCFGAVYSWKTWLLVLVMMTTGILLRHSSFPKPVLAVVYIMVGWGLFWSSRNGWQAWRRNFRNNS